MNYIAIKVNADYNMETDEMNICLTYINNILKNISQENLTTTENGILTPKDDVVEKIERYYAGDKNQFGRISKRNVKRTVENAVNSDEKEYTVLVGTVSLTDEGEIHSMNHHTAYTFDGESQNQMNSYFQ
jgi:IMP dehydrogenase/GMP reductase